MALAGTNADVQQATAAGDAFRDPIKVWSIKYFGATTAGHSVELQDDRGEVAYSATVSGANGVDIQYYPGKVFYGLHVESIDSGTVEVVMM